MKACKPRISKPYLIMHIEEVPVVLEAPIKINISMEILSKKLTCIGRICSHLSHYTAHRTEI